MRLLRRLVRYGAVSVVVTSSSLALLGLLLTTTSLHAAWANVVATAVVVGPSFELNRRFVWSRTGQRSLAAEVVPFWVLAFAGLGLSTLAVDVAARWAASSALAPASRTIVVEVAGLAAWATLWVVRFVLLDRVVFAGRLERAVVPAVEPAVVARAAAPNDGVGPPRTI